MTFQHADHQTDGTNLTDHDYTNTGQVARLATPVPISVW